MNLQAKLTLGYVMLAVLMVSVISGVDFANNVQQQFESTLRFADEINPVAAKFVKRTINKTTKSFREALRDKELSSDLLDLVVDANPILEIAVIDPKNNEVLADTDPTRLGEIVGPYPDFRQLVKEVGPIGKIKVLYSHTPQYYQLERKLATPAG